jgi:hypothetical protein
MHGAGSAAAGAAANIPASRAAATVSFLFMAAFSPITG